MTPKNRIDLKTSMPSDENNEGENTLYTSDQTAMETIGKPSQQVEENLGDKMAQDRRMQQISFGKTGIRNSSGSDCFLISIFQLVMHSRLLSYLMDRRNLDMQSPRFQSLQTLVKDYWKASLQETRVENLNDFRKQIARENPDLEHGQQDVDEALKQIFAPYKNTPTTTKAYYRRWLEVPQDMSSFPEATKANSNQCRFLEREIEPLKPEKETLMTLYLAIPVNSERKKGDERPLYFSSMIHNLFEKKEVSREYNAIYKGKRVKAKLIEQLCLTTLGECLFVSIKRYTKEAEKICNDVIVQEREKISYLNYALQAFIIHDGNTKNGHYTTCCKIQGKWWYFNDEEKPIEKSWQEAQALAKGAYIYYFERQRGPKSLSRSYSV